MSSNARRQRNEVCHWLESHWLTKKPEHQPRWHWLRTSTPVVEAAAKKHWRVCLCAQPCHRTGQCNHPWAPSPPGKVPPSSTNAGRASHANYKTPQNFKALRKKFIYETTHRYTLQPATNLSHHLSHQPPAANLQTNRDKLVAHFMCFGFSGEASSTAG
jgi:hypothetical protein